MSSDQEVFHGTEEYNGTNDDATIKKCQGVGSGYQVNTFGSEYIIFHFH